MDSPNPRSRPGRIESTPTEIPEELFDLAPLASHVCVLTGAGMSAESGIPTFRDPTHGLWENYNPEDLVSVQGWQADPHLVWAWHLWFQRLCASCEPNAGHRALGRWARLANTSAAPKIDIVTQNIDDLHERGGSEVLAHLHGDISTLRCADCGLVTDKHALAPTNPASFPAEDAPRIPPPRCTTCGGYIRHSVTWFGEALPTEAIDRAMTSAMTCDLMIVIGTSGSVYPAAGLPRLAADRGVPVVEINPRDTELTASMDVVWREGAAVALPALVAVLIDHHR
ncbi:MAG: NAD-dependent deacylase [Bowdeniella nasicola]|nr:NAD-dependent deacylase [Bowdeniella nasicola]